MNWRAGEGWRAGGRARGWVGGGAGKGSNGQCDYVVDPTDLVASSSTTTTRIPATVSPVLLPLLLAAVFRLAGPSRTRLLIIFVIPPMAHPLAHPRCPCRREVHAAAVFAGGVWIVESNPPRVRARASRASSKRDAASALRLRLLPKAGAARLVQMPAGAPARQFFHGRRASREEEKTREGGRGGGKTNRVCTEREGRARREKEKKGGQNGR